MKKLIGNHRFLYNQGINYYYSLPRGYYIPDKGDNTRKNYLLYENEYLLVEIGGTHSYGILPSYDADTGKRKNQTDFKAVRTYLKSILPEWFKQGNFPAHSIDQASREVADKYKQTREARMVDKKKFRMNYKSKRKQVIQTIPMEASSVNKKGVVYSRLFKKIDSRLYTKEPMDFKNNDKEYKISYNRNNFKFHVSLIVNKKTVKENKDRVEWCSIDPGEKTFATVYDPFNRNVLFVGNNERDKFSDSTISKLQSRLSKINSKNTHKKKILNKAIQTAREKDKNKRNDLHQKLANYLCSNFKHIIVPKYGIKNMNVNSTVNKSMRNLGFFQFLTFLKHKCSEYNTKLYIVEEHYTTKACCRCGKLNKTNDREYNCHGCGLEINRDVNGAINIALKHLQSKSK
jgi:putative transposase